MAANKLMEYQNCDTYPETGGHTQSSKYNILSGIEYSSSLSIVA